MFVYPRRLLILWLVTRTVCGAVHVELNDGQILAVDDEQNVTPTVDSEPGDPIFGGLTLRDLFGRQYCSDPGQNVICGNGCCPNNNYCCDGISCIDTTSRLCCRNGRQCYKGGDCCTDGNCCDPGKYCVRYLDTGRIGCLSYGGGGSTTIRASTITSTRTTWTTRTTSTTRTTRTTSTTSTTRTTRTTQPPASSFTCNDAGYRPCPGERFCCPSTAYCFYNTQQEPRCYRNSYYTFYYSYSWSFTYGIRWFTTTTTYYLNGASVPRITTPPVPTTPPPEAETSATVSAASTTPSSRTSAESPSSTSDSPGSALPGGVAEDSQGSTTSTSTTSSSSRTSSATARATLTGGATSKAHKLIMAGWMTWAWMALVGVVFFIV